MDNKVPRPRKRKVKESEDDEKPLVKRRVTTKAAGVKSAKTKKESTEVEKPKRKVINKESKKELHSSENESTGSEKPKRKVMKKESKKELHSSDNENDNFEIEDGLQNQNDQYNSLWNETEMLSYCEKISPYIAQKFVSLINEGCTLPFIARYRKEAVGHIMPDR